MVAALGKQCNCQWDMLPAENQYGWRFLIKHLRAADREEQADRLLTNYAWIKAKLRASSAQDLYDSYLPESQADGARLIGRAIALSVPTLTACLGEPLKSRSGSDKPFAQRLKMHHLRELSPSRPPSRLRLRPAQVSAMIAGLGTG